MRNIWAMIVLLFALLVGCTNEQDAVSKPAEQPKQEAKEEAKGETSSMGSIYRSAQPLA